MTSSSFKHVSALLALASGLLAVPAWSAPEPSSSEISVARSLFDEGKAAEDAGQFRVAAEKFRRAATIKDTPGIRFHLARCEEEQGAFVEALVEYDRARELIDGGVRAPDVERLLPAARERVRAKVALLTVKLPDDVKNVSVELDGRALSASVLNVPMPINPGRHRLTAVSVGRTRFASELELGTGEVKQLVIELPVTTTVPAPPPPAEPPAPLAARSASSRDAGSSISPRTIALVGEATLFAAGLSTGIIFMVARSSATDRYQTANEAVLSAVGGQDPDGVACAGSSPPAACAELYDAGQDRARAGNWATAGFITAGVSAAAFGLTYWLWPDEAPATAQASVGPRSFALSVTGRF